jgi:PAS domain S-box-containing protein
MQRNGFIEETYFSWSIIPLIGVDGSVVGLYNPAFEKTKRKIAERRMLTLREIGEKTASAREVSQFWGLLIEGLQYNEFDAPLVLVYSLADDGSSDDGSSVSSGTLGQSKQCVLEGFLGVSAGHPAAPERIDLKSGKEGFVSAFRLAMTSDKPIVLSEEDKTLDTSLLDDIQWRGWGDPSRTVVICPIRPTTGESTLGFLVMCTNPRRPYDEDYKLFAQLLGRQLATSIASVVLFEEEIRRGEQAAKLAAQDRIELSTQLAARTQEAAESELKFTRMAELAPVGMFMADSQGQITYCNDTWYDIAQHPRGEAIGDRWAAAIKPEDLPTVERNWNAMLEDLTPISVQFRFKHPWRDKNGNTGDTWVLANSYPEKGPDGKLKSVFGSVTDISSQKFVEDLQKRRMEEAMELKRQQENFIDTTSHEMRNPLSAILQCADEISATLSELRSTESLSEAQAAVVDSSIDAAQTITLCALHQKRIVDDVLTLSKLDSAMLLVTPVDVQPATVVQKALKMFEGELQNADIVLEFNIHESFHSLRIDWVRLDPSRLLQVLINLTTNVRRALRQKRASTD